MTRTRYVIGAMTGTSLDGLDAALVGITGGGMDMAATFLGMVSEPLSADLRESLYHMASGLPSPPIDYLSAARAVGRLYSRGVGRLLECDRLPRGVAVDFVVAHGQTIWHAPGHKQAAGESERLSWQLFDPWPIVRDHGLPVCYDLRQADLIAGGEGAPLTPITDPILYQMDDGMVFNFGGVCNFTRWTGRAGNITGRDVYPCNLLLDGLVQQLFPDRRFDEDGRIAASAPPQPAAVRQVAAAIDKVISSHGSLGREQFSPQWVASLINDLRSEASTDTSSEQIISAATQAVAIRVNEQIEQAGPAAAVLAGGGARNKTLVQRIAQLNTARVPIHVSDDLGIPCEAREAMSFAILGALSRDGVAASLPSVTGSKAPGVAGAWVGL